MAKIKSIKKYAEELWKDLEELQGERPQMLRHLVEKTAADQRHLQIIDNELEDAELTSLVIGSTGQQKTEVNPLLTLRDKVSRTLTDDLEALQLTARSLYKKKDATPDKGDADPMLEFLGTVKR